MHLAPGHLSIQSCAPRISPTDYVISVSKNASDFENLRSEWKTLRKRGEEQDPFLSCDWFGTWWRAFSSQRTLWLVTARYHGQLRAVLPLMLEHTWRHGIPVRRLAAIGNDHTPRFDLVRARDDEHVHCSLWNHLMTMRSEWDVFELLRLSANSITTERFVRLAAEQGARINLWKRAPRSPWISIEPSWDAYLDSRSAGFRKSLRQKMRRLAELGRVSLETVTSPEALEQALTDGLYIEAEGWKGTRKTAILSEPAVTRFYTELAEIMAASGNLRLHFLTLNDVRIAFDYSIIANRCLYSLKAGHSSTYARFSPGTLMLSLILKQAHEEGLAGLDLLGESDEFKLHWTDAARTNQWLHCYSDSWRGRLLYGIKSRSIPVFRRPQHFDHDG